MSAERTKVFQYCGSSRNVSSTSRQLRWVCAPLNCQPFLNREEDLADAEEADNRHHKVEAAHELDRAKGQTELTADDIHANRCQDETQYGGSQGLDRGATSQTDKGAERQELDTEKFRRAELERKLSNKGRKEGHQDDGEGCPDKGGRKRRGEGLPALPLPGQRMTVEGGGHRPGLARDVEEYRGNRPTKQGTPVDTREQDDRRCGWHSEGDRQQDRYPIRSPKTRQHADDGTQNDSHCGDHQVVGGERDLESHKEVGEGIHTSRSPLP